MRRRDISYLAGLEMCGLEGRLDDREYLLLRRESISSLLMSAFNKKLYLFDLRSNIIKYDFSFIFSFLNQLYYIEKSSFKDSHIINELSLALLGNTLNWKVVTSHHFLGILEEQFIVCTCFEVKVRLNLCVVEVSVELFFVVKDEEL